MKHIHFFNLPFNMHGHISFYYSKQTTWLRAGFQIDPRYDKYRKQRLSFQFWFSKFCLSGDFFVPRKKRLKMVKEINQNE